MTYTPHVWSRHDKLDSLSLNNLEQAVGAFSGTADEATAAAATANTAAANAAQSAQAAAASAALVGAPAGAAIDAHLAPNGVLLPATISHADVQAALTAAATSGQRVQAGGSYTTDQTLIIQCDADLSGLTITYTGTGVAVQVGSTDTGTVIFRKTVTCPRVINNNKTNLGWAQVAGSVGVDLVNLNSCPSIVVPYAANFDVNLRVRGVGQGNAYNNFFIGMLSNGRINELVTASSGGWSNQNQRIGGRYFHTAAEGTNVSGTRHVEMDVAAASPVNNNTWIGSSLEGSVAEYAADFAGSTNLMLNCRWENANGPKVRWQSGATQNRIMDGTYAGNIIQTFGGGNTGNRIESGAGSTLVGASGTKPVLAMENQSSSNNLALAITNAGALATGANPATAYTIGIAANGIYGKQAADAYNRIFFDTINGKLWMGNGAAAPVSWVGGTGSFFLFGGATTVGPSPDGSASLGTASNYRFDYIRARTAVVTGAGITANRPAPATAGAGAMFYDTTLGKPIWSTGSAWHDATGATV